MLNKINLFDELITDMGKCSSCLNIITKTGKDNSLVNFYLDKELATQIPSIWTDWYNRLNSEIMIVGQDWGPFDDMKQLNQRYMENKTKENWIRIIETEKSFTKKQLTKFMVESSNGKLNTIDNIYITNAIMCGRKGKNYRGNNINLKYSTISCQKFLLRQINIVKPKIILTLGYYPLLSLAKIFDFNIETNLKKTIEKTPIFFIKEYVIIPLYHPVAQIKKEEQLNQYNKIWNFID